ncbi:MAG: hypothetical protein JXA54_13725 [Candidatus Heimdallarchaeota archaeon]|nr:hypothetical protein [Candidatus Heimdallarchaeota archaeon]
MLNAKIEDLDLPQDKQLDNGTIALENRITTFGENKNFIKELAARHFEEGNHYRALSCYFKLLEFEPRNAKIWNKIAVIFIKLENFETAIEFSKIAYRLINNDYQ